MSRFLINNFDFDAQSGVILTPQRDARVYTTPASPHFGLQILPPRGPEFVLNLTRYTHVMSLEATQRLFVETIGQLVTIVDGPNQYLFPPWQLRFAVVDVQITSAVVIPYAQTTRGSAEFSFSPAGVIHSQWKMHAIPA